MLLHVLGCLLSKTENHHTLTPRHSYPHRTVRRLWVATPLSRLGSLDPFPLPSRTEPWDRTPLNIIATTPEFMPRSIIPAPMSGHPPSDARKPRNAAQALGQVFTPPQLARMILDQLTLPITGLRHSILDPCVGPATFPSQLSGDELRHLNLTAIDVDRLMIRRTQQWALRHKPRITTVATDYLLLDVPNQFDFAVLNPPYIRQEWISKKQLYRQFFESRLSLTIPGSANLYVYFIIKAMHDLRPGGRLACIVYDSWQATRYGDWLKKQLLVSASSLKVIPAPSTPFQGRVIDATIISAVKRADRSPAKKLCCPTLSRSTTMFGLAPIGELFTSFRGLRLKQARFFMTDLSGCGRYAATPFVKKVTLIPGYAVPALHPEAVLLVTPTRQPLKAVRELSRRLANAKRLPSQNIPILTWWRSRRSAWMYHSPPPSAPIIFNYYLRNRPRHIRNARRIFSDNFYGLSPKTKSIPPLAWLAALNASISCAGILNQARNQGAGLAKLQLYEYRRALVLDIRRWPKPAIARLRELGHRLVRGSDVVKCIAAIDQLVFDTTHFDPFRPQKVSGLLTAADLAARRPSTEGDR